MTDTLEQVARRLIRDCEWHFIGSDLAHDHYPRFLVRNAPLNGHYKWKHGLEWFWIDPQSRDHLPLMREAARRLRRGRYL